LKGERLARLAAEVPAWEVIEEHHLRREFKFKDFASALAWVNRVGEIAEAQGHHPWVHFTWGKVVLELWTHKVGGLVLNDFILAAHLDREWNARQENA
jgi:4a-hydroxytetrahydrobiopterin dehydratase